MGYERTIAECYRYTPEQQRALRNRLNQLLNEEVIDSFSTDDFELFQAGSTSVLNKAREQRDRYKAERDAADESLARVSTQINAHIKIAFSKATEAQNRLVKLQKDFDELDENVGIPSIAKIWMSALSMIIQPLYNLSKVQQENLPIAYERKDTQYSM